MENPSRQLKIIAGTNNPAKLAAIREVLALYPQIAHNLFPLEVESGVPNQPIGLTQIREGAITRARSARVKGAGDLGIGIESGIFEIEDSMFDIGVCVIDDGEQLHYGTTAAFVIPPRIAQFVKQGHELSQACRLAKFTTEDKIGAKRGLIHLLTNGRIDRAAFSKPAIMMAMCSLELPHNYKV